MPDIFIARTEEIHAFPRSMQACKRWPLAGLPLTPMLRDTLGMSATDSPFRLKIAGTSQDYLVENRYLIPYYRREEDVLARTDIADRNAELIVDRVRSFVGNAQPNLESLRTKDEIDTALAEFHYMPEETDWECGLKAAAFKRIVGAIMMRFETLGRIITQHNTQGARIEYTELNGQSVIPDDAISSLKEEYRGYYRLLTSEKMLPLLPVISLNDDTRDHDGILRDLLFEIGKPIRADTPHQEGWMRDGIVQKIGQSIQSIDSVHSALKRVLTTRPSPSQAVFERSVREFITRDGASFGIATVQDIIGNLDRYALFCRALAGVKTRDPAYDELFHIKDALANFFAGENGLLIAMKRVGNDHTSDVNQLQRIISRGITIMGRTANTRIPCDEHAPQPWIPNLDPNAPAMERYMANSLLSKEGRSHAQRVMEGMKTHMNDLPAVEKTRYLNKHFCSLGLLQDDIAQLNRKLGHERSPAR